MNRLLNIQSKHFKGRLQEGSIISELPLCKHVLKLRKCHPFDPLNNIPANVFLWSFKLKVLVWNLSVLIRPFIPPPHLWLPFPFFYPLGEESIIHAFPSLGECPLQQGLKSAGLTEVKPKLRWGNSIRVHLFLDEHFILGEHVPQGSMQGSNKC